MSKTITSSDGTEQDREFIRFLWKLLGWGATTEDAGGRRVVITPYEGNWGVAGHVIAVEGSPPRGVVYIPSTEAAIVFGDSGSNAKTIRRHRTQTSTRNLETILDYLKHRGYEPASPI